MKACRSIEQPVDEVAARGVDRERLPQAREAVHLAARVVRLDETVGVEQEAVARADHALGFLVFHVWQQPQGHARRTELADLSAGADVGQVVARVGEAERAARRVQHAIQAGDEHVGRHLLAEQLVGSPQHRPGFDQSWGFGAQDRVGPRHDQRCRDTLVGDVTHDYADAPFRQLHEIVEVPADRASWAVVGRDLPLGQVGQRVGEELLLDHGSDPQLLFHALALSLLGRLRLDELGHADGRRSQTGQRAEEPTVVGRVILLRQPGPEVERPDELTLRHQRHDHLDASLPHRVERRRLQGQTVDLHDLRRGSEHREQRVVRGDLDGRDLRNLGRGTLDVFAARGRPRGIRLDPLVGSAVQADGATQRLDDRHGRSVPPSRPRIVTALVIAHHLPARAATALRSRVGPPGRRWRGHRPG